MILIYACIIISAVTCESTNRDREYTPNVGTVLFSPSDAKKKHWTKNEVGLLQARKYFQNLLPPPIFINTFNEDHVKILLSYFRDAYAAIRKEAKDPETDTIMTTALSDAIGGYFKVWVLPIAKLDYYGGTISQANVIKLFQFYNEIKRYLDTDGEGWHKPEEKTLNTMTINVAPLQLFSNTRSMNDPCDHLAYFEKTPTGLGIPIPNVNWNDKFSTMFVPLKNVSLISMNTPNSSSNLIKYYDAARSCIQTSNPKEQNNFDEKFQKWLIDEVVPHLKDENLYLALGNVLTLVNRTRDICNSVLDLYVSKCTDTCQCNKCKSKKKTIKIPCDISSKKMWILIIILLIEVAWCVPALIFVLCCKKFQQRDCSSNVYLFIDNEKKDRGGGEGKGTSVTNCPVCVESAPSDIRIIRKSLFNTVGQRASVQQTKTKMETGTTPCINQCTSKQQPDCPCVPENKCPELCYISKRCSVKKTSALSVPVCDSTQIISLSSNETFASKQSSKSGLTIVRSKTCTPSGREVLAKSKRKRGGDECRRHEDRTRSDECCGKYNERRRSEECRKLEEMKQADECRKLQELRQAEECRILEERRKAEECRKLEECRQAEERRILQELRQAEERRILEERRQAEEFRKLEEYRQAEECRKLEEQRQAEKCRILEELRQAEECRKLEEYRQAEECRKLQEQRQAEKCRILEEIRQTEECRKLEEYRLAEECRKLQELRQAEECSKLEECRQAEECRKLQEQRQAEKCRILEECRQAEECRQLEECGKSEECRQLEECQQAEECTQLEECQQAEECTQLEECQQAEKCRQLEECRHAEKCRQLEELRQAKACRKCEERRQCEECQCPIELCPELCYISKRSSLKKTSGLLLQECNSTQIFSLSSHETFTSKQSGQGCLTIRSKPCIPPVRGMLTRKRNSDESRRYEDLTRTEDCRQPNERRQSNECKKPERWTQSEGYKNIENYRKHEIGIQSEELRRLEERRLGEQRRRLEQQSQTEECRQIKESRQAEECKKLEKQRQAVECRDLRQLSEYKDLQAHGKLEECRKTKPELNKNIEENTDSKESGVLQKHDERQEVEEYRNIDEPSEVSEYSDNFECFKISENREYEEYVEFDESNRCVEHSVKSIDSCMVGHAKTLKENADDCDDYGDYNESICSRQIYSKETCQGVCPCTECLANKNSIAASMTCCNINVTDVKYLPDNQVGKKSTRFHVTKEFKTVGKVGSKPSSGKPYLEITIDRPGAEICVDMTQCRAHYTQNRRSRIPKLAACSLQPSISGRQSIGSNSEKHKSLIPQLKKKTTDDMDLEPCSYSKSFERKLNGSF